MTKFYIDGHGCAKNQTDGELLVSFLEKEGFVHTFDANQADFILINSCGFIESAKKESIDAVYDISASYPEAKLIMTGCLSERYSQMLFEQMPELSGVFGNGDLSKIAGFMKAVQKEGRKVEVYPQSGVCSGERTTLFNYKGSAFVKITEGCSNNCSFCAIPLIRGSVRSRSSASIVQEIKGLVENGVYEINLIGQDLAAYEDPSETDTSTRSLSHLLKQISQLPGDFIIRLLYIHPDHFNTDILPVIKADPRFVHYFDIPFQSGDDAIIKVMNRTGSQKKYIELIERIKAQLPDCVIRTTFLTGFPGETDGAAENTLSFLRAIRPDWSGCFPYSREENTPACSLKGRVSGRVAKKRAELLEETQSQITLEKLNQYKGQELSVLVEEIIELDEKVAEDSSEGLALGRSWFQAPEVDGCVVIRYDRDFEEQKKAVQPGNVVKVKVLAVTGVDLDSSFIELQKTFPSDSRLKFVQ